MSFSTPSRQSPAVSTASSTIPRTPPTQIFTRGKVGSVKTSTTNTITSSSAGSRSSSRGRSINSHGRLWRNGNATVVSNSSSSGKPARSRSQTRDDDQSSLERRRTSRSTSRARSLSRVVGRTTSSRSGSGTGGGSEIGSLTSFPPGNRDSSPSSDTIGSSRRRRHLRKTKILMDELSRAPPEHRIACITNTCEVLDHHDTQYHNSELSLGVATVLVNQLKSTSNQEEIRMLVAALEMVLRASPQSTRVAYEAWPANVLGRLVRLLESHETTRIPHGEITSLNLIKILTCLAKVPDFRPLLMKTQGVDALMLRIAKTQHKAMRLKLIHNLCQHQSNQTQILNHTPLMNLVLHIAHHDNDACRQYAASILMELASSSTTNQTAMAHDDKILGTIVKLVLTDHHSGTRESVLTALQNLAFIHGNRHHLVTYKEGIVLEALQKALSSDSSTKSRRRAAGALTNLACDETASTMGDHPGLLDALAVASTNGVDEVQSRASLALTKIAGSISVVMSCFPTVLDALVVASLSSSAGNVAAILRLKARLPENRGTMARHHGVLDTLADLCHGPHNNHAVRALMHIANDVTNHELLGHSRAVLDALVANAASKQLQRTGSTIDNPTTDLDVHDARDCALVALERLAVCVSLRPHLARHPGLITAVAQAVEREAQWQDEEGSGAVEQPLTNVTRTYLAKPLLMSLLVAM